MNVYEISELEGQELHCEWCGELVSTTEYIDNDGFCNTCARWNDEDNEEEEEE